MARKENEAPGMFACHGTGGNQEWVFDQLTKTFKNAISGLCLDLSTKKEVTMVKCEKVSFELLKTDGRECAPLII